MKAVLLMICCAVVAMASRRSGARTRHSICDAADGFLFSRSFDTDNCLQGGLCGVPKGHLFVRDVFNNAGDDPPLSLPNSVSSWRSDSINCFGNNVPRFGVLSGDVIVTNNNVGIAKNQSHYYAIVNGRSVFLVNYPHSFVVRRYVC